MRAFIAVPLSNDETHAVQELQECLRDFPPFSSFRWVPPSNIHMTLRFFEEISENEAASVASVLDRACSHRGSFSFSLERLGVFPRPKTPHVLWAGPSQPPGGLIYLAESLAGELKAAGFPAEDRPFRPHLTLARRRRGAHPVEGIGEALREAGERWLSPPIVIRSREAVLFRSELRPGGAVHQAVHRVQLAG